GGRSRSSGRSATLPHFGNELVKIEGFAGPTLLAFDQRAAELLELGLLLLKQPKPSLNDIAWRLVTPFLNLSLDEFGEVLNNRDGGGFGHRTLILSPEDIPNRAAHDGANQPSFFCTRSSKRATLTTTRSCVPSPTVSFSSRASTANFRRRPSTPTSRAVAHMRMPTGVAAWCETSRWMPRLWWPSGSSASTQSSAAASIRLIITGVASTRTRPLPTRGAVCASATTSSARPSRPIGRCEKSTIGGA